MNYEQWARKECLLWQRRMLKKTSLFGKSAQKVQNKINQKIPQKVHDVITESIKHMVRAVLKGSEWTTDKPLIVDRPLHEREDRLRDKIRFYKRLAAVEGAGTGAGGFLMGMADFPMLLSIKVRFLYDAAGLYGFDVKDYRERLFILHIFQIAFSNGEKRREVFFKLKRWEETLQDFPSEATYLEQLDWKDFQQTYRDHIDLVKMLQLIPGFGAVVGGVANYRFLDHLGKTAMNAYRMRLFETTSPAGEVVID